MALEVTIKTDKNKFGYTGGTALLTVTVKNTGDLRIYFNVLKIEGTSIDYYCDGSPELKTALKALNREYIDANDSFTFYTSVTVPAFNANNN